MSAPLDELLDELETRPVLRPADVVPILRILCTEYPQLAHRLELVELAVRGIAYEPVEETEPEVTTTVFGIPVRLREGHTADDVREFVERLRPGLTGAEVVHALVDGGLVYRKIREG